MNPCVFYNLQVVNILTWLFSAKVHHQASGTVRLKHAVRIITDCFVCKLGCLKPTVGTSNKSTSPKRKPMLSAGAKSQKVVRVKRARRKTRLSPRLKKLPRGAVRSSRENRSNVSRFVSLFGRGTRSMMFVALLGGRKARISTVWC
jgi:hypothetical protein